MASGKRRKPTGRVNKDTADRAVRFFEEGLRHIKGKWAGQPFKLLPWQKRVVREIFGTLKSDGTRQYKTAYIEIPRKAGKSTLASGIALYLLFEGEPGAEIYSAAGDREQAAIVFEQAKQMVLASPELSEYVQTFRRSIFLPQLMASYKVLSADAGTKHGSNPHGIIFDELHVQPNRHLWDALITGTGARKQPLTVAITTAGYDRQSLCWEMHEYAEKVIAGIIDDPTFYGVIFKAEDSDPWQDVKTWRKANPSLGHTVYMDYYREEFAKASKMPSYENTVRRLLLNQWTQQASRWLSMDVWDANYDPDIIEDNISGQCFGGLDLASVSDMTAWVMVFPRPLEDKVDVLARFWVPEAQVNNPKNRMSGQYQVWAREGFLEVTPGNSTDYNYIKKQVLDDAEKFGLVDMNVDRWQAHHLVTELSDEGLTVLGMGQGFASMSGPSKELERVLLDSKLNHMNNPILRWMADNVAVRTDPAANIKPDKENSQGKIDGIVALIMALERMMRHENTTSIYETQDYIVAI